MITYLFTGLLHKRIAEKGKRFSAKEITVFKDGFYHDVVDVVYCERHEGFHIETERKREWD